MNFKNNKGAALVEMAIILPLLLLIVFGIFEFGRAMMITNSLTNAAREGARRAAVSPSPLDEEILNAFIKAAIPFNTDDLDIETAPLSPVPGAAVKVIVTLPFTPVMNFIPLKDITLKGEASMRYEYTGP